MIVTDAKVAHVQAALSKRPSLVFELKNRGRIDKVAPTDLPQVYGLVARAAEYYGRISGAKSFAESVELLLADASRGLHAPTELLMRALERSEEIPDPFLNFDDPAPAASGAAGGAP